VTVLTASFEHLFRLTDHLGIVEHAQEGIPRSDCGYCLDDVARGLVVAMREPEPSARVAALGMSYLGFIGRAQAADGRFHNRLDVSGRWADTPSVDDCWGRALWGLGTAAARGPSAESRAVALRCFERSAKLRSPHRRAMAFAAVGAGEVLIADPGHRVARELLVAVVASIGPVALLSDWPWPEPRLSYANAAIPEALIIAGRALDDEVVLGEGLGLLAWLLSIETRNGHLSPSPVGGWTLGERRPGFDQQPIEAGHLADACATAFAVTGEARWADGVDLALGWFLGDNDVGVALHDPETGGGCDGLERHGRNANQGAESTLALVSTIQHALRMKAARP
jgi:hypothetical protein